MDRLFLGLDSSTQSLSAIVIDYDTRRVVYDKSLNFDKALPHYSTQNGTLRGDDPLVVHSPPLMWAEALDVLFAQMKQDGVPLGDILAVSGSGQQHGSVYLNDRAAGALAKLNPKNNLVENLRGIFSRATAPIWMDSSTSAECAEIREKLGGIKATAQETGSDTFEQFTGPQIRKFFKTDPDNYAATSRIALISSFTASLLAGKIAPIDHGDGAGMNLMDIRKKTWHPAALRATAPGLKSKLPPLTEPWKVIGTVSPYFANKYGLNPAQALVWSGDNPCSAVGLGLIHEGKVAISLGTSYTYFGRMQQCRVDLRGEGSVFGAPTGDYLPLICFINGSLARERIRDQYGLDWEGYNQLLLKTKPGNNGAIMLPWFEPEIVPRVNQPGVHRFDFDKNNLAAQDCRAIMEAQMMSMRIHSAWMKFKPTSICATGGGSMNLPVLQIMADVFNCPVRRIEVAKSAALGAALRAVHGWLLRSGKKPKWQEVVSVFTDPIPNSEVKPIPKSVRIYDQLVKKYAACERRVLTAGLARCHHP